MTNEELDRARAAEAAKNVNRVGVWENSLDVYTISAIREAARLAREGWVPEPVDPDLAETITLAKGFELAYYIPVLEGIKRGRELERDAADIEIDQLQETILNITEPETPEIDEYMLYGAPHNVRVTKLKLKGTAEAKPGMVWVKHDRSEKSPVSGDTWVLVRNYDPETTYAMAYACSQAHKRLWKYVTHYAIITQPEDAV